jgi:hypothetical protein
VKIKRELLTLKQAIMKVKITQNHEFFNGMNAPSCNLETIPCNVKFPTHLCTGKIYYCMYDNKLTAFKILAYGVYSTYRHYQHIGISYLVQFPGEEPRWIKDFLKEDTRIFESKEDFLTHQNNGNHNVDLHWLSNVHLREITHSNAICLVGKCYAWNKTRLMPYNEFLPCILHFMVIDDTLYICVSKTCSDGKVYLSKEECVADNLNNLDIVEFADEPIIEVNVNFATERKVVHTLRFIED